MAYTQSIVKPQATPGKTNFGGAVVDANRIGMVGNNSFFQTQDAAASPVTSPLAMTGSVQTLTVPANALSVTVTPETTIVQVSEDSTMSVYSRVQIGQSQTFPVARQQYIYLKGTSSNVVSFFFSET